jgi:hypothetical protein
VHHVPNPATAPVSPQQGEFLFFRVEAGGPVPRFQFSSDVKGLLLNQGTFPQDPAPAYEWTYLRDPSDIQQFELLSAAFLFAANAVYRYRVTVHGPAGPLRPVLDIEYTGAAADFDTEVFRVLIV